MDGLIPIDGTASGLEEVVGWMLDKFAVMHEKFTFAALPEFAKACLSSPKIDTK